MKFCNLTAFSMHLTRSVEQGAGHVTSQNLGWVADRNIHDVLECTVLALQLHFQLPVYVKENISPVSKSTTIAVFWSLRWMYLTFTPQRGHIKAVVTCRKTAMEGVHHMLPLSEKSCC
jgi:hypothetical protein